MKRKILGVMVCSLLMSLYVGPSVSAASSLDQYCHPKNPSTEIMSSAGTGRDQSFTPSKNRLTAINFTLASQSESATVKLGIGLFNPSGQLLKTTELNAKLVSSGHPITWTLNSPITVTPKATYRVRLVPMTPGENIFWYYESNCYSAGTAYGEGAPLPWDFVFETYGYNYVAPVATSPTQTSTDTTTSTSPQVTTATAKVVAADKLAVPLNFRVDRDLGNEIIFAWDLNKEKDLAGYVLYIYEATKEEELEIIDIPDKLQDNYNVILADHPLLRAGGEYDVKLAAKNTAGAVSEKTLSLRVSYDAVAAAEATELTLAEKLINPYVLGGLGLLLVSLIALLVYLEKKYHGLGKLFKKSN